MLNEKLTHCPLMLQEIFEQPNVVRACLQAFAIAAPDQFLSASATTKIVDLPWPTSLTSLPEQIHLIASGTSFHACLVGQFLLEQWAGIPTRVYTASELRYAVPPLTQNNLVIGVSQSGETADVLTALAQLRQVDQRQSSSTSSHFWGITNQSGSSLEHHVQFTLHTPAGLEVGVAATKTFSATLMALYSLALAFAHQRQTLTPQTLNTLLTGLCELPNLIQKTLDTLEPAIAPLIHDWQTVQSSVVLGRGLQVPIALEGALKLKETSYIHAEGYAAGEFMHGPVAFLDAKTPVIAIAMPGVTYEPLLANLEKVKRQGAPLVAITSIPHEIKPLALFDQILPLPTVEDYLSPFLTVLPLQLLAYHAAMQRKINPDKPRGLVKYLDQPQ
jgi:glucosamine--fructose-6-phosphate aminotransferase (isomerizing)